MKICRLLIIGLIVLVSLGRIMPMSIFPEPWHPWYMEYTTRWFIAAGFIFLPSGLVSDMLGLFSLDGKWFLIVDAIWLIWLCLVIYHVSFQRDKTSGET